MRKVITWFFLSCNCLASENSSWLDHVSTRTDQDAIEWLKENLKLNVHQTEQQIANRTCDTCSVGKFSETDPKIYIFISFSVPDETWISLSKELGKYQGTFVIRGIPNNSFQEFAKRVVNLKKKGLNGDIQINPILFKQFDVKEVPTFLNTDSLSLISGNISFEYALGLIANKKIPQAVGQVDNQPISLNNVEEQ